MEKTRRVPIDMHSLVFRIEGEEVRIDGEIER
jgi:hypothetical protein